MIALVTGDRFAKSDQWKEIIGRAFEYYGIDTVIHGGARGIDTIAANVAFPRGMVVHQFNADWKLYGKSAGPIRNRQMLEFLSEMIAQGNEGVVLAFHPNINRSKGTRNMCDQAVNAGIRVRLFEKGST